MLLIVGRVMQGGYYGAARRPRTRCQTLEGYRGKNQTKGWSSSPDKADPEIRWLLYVAAIAASKTATWKPFYEAQRERSLSSTEAFVMLARKLARVVFALLKNQSEYQKRWFECLPQTIECPTEFAVDSRSRHDTEPVGHSMVRASLLFQL